MNQTVILCVDDDATVLGALRTLLARHLGPGPRLEIAESGEEALEVIEELQADGDALAVVISDFIMPGMKGDELLVQVHARCPSAVTIMLTGQSSLEGVKRAINEAGLYRFLEKPFNNADLVLTAREAQRRFQGERTLAEVEALLTERLPQVREALSRRLPEAAPLLDDPPAADEAPPVARRLEQLLEAVQRL